MHLSLWLLVSGQWTKWNDHVKEQYEDGEGTQAEVVEDMGTPGAAQAAD